MTCLGLHSLGYGNDSNVVILAIEYDLNLIYIENILLIFIKGLHFQ